MALRRFLISPEAIQAAHVTFSPETSHHIATVLRLRPGTRVVAFDGRGGEHVVELTTVAPREVQGRIAATRPGGDGFLRVILLQAVAQGGKMDTVVRMGTELGIAEFVPLLTRRAVARPGPARLQRWRRIAAAAARQSGRSTVPRIADPCPLGEVWPLVAGALVLLPYEEERGRSIASVLAANRGAPTVAILIGPEGGWAPEEVREATSRGAHPVTLGNLILRTETAGVVTAAMVFYELALRGEAEA